MFFLFLCLKFFLALMSKKLISVYLKREVSTSSLFLLFVSPKLIVKRNAECTGGPHIMVLYILQSVANLCRNGRSVEYIITLQALVVLFLLQRCNEVPHPGFPNGEDRKYPGWLYFDRIRSKVNFKSGFVERVKVLFIVNTNVYSLRSNGISQKSLSFGDSESRWL